MNTSIPINSTESAMIMLVLLLVTAPVASEPNGKSQERIPAYKLSDHKLSAQGEPATTSNILDNSYFITFKDHSCIVPKGAVVFVPENLKPYITSTPVFALQRWSEVYRRNRDTLITIEVTLNQAAGAEKIESQKLEKAKKTGKIVISVVNGFPTSSRLAVGDS